ncbi:MAG TPA: YfiR family protein [Holophagaceae bacterium]|nr:YfiR family protein [Holophagaceae bacterium]
MRLRPRLLPLLLTASAWAGSPQEAQPEYAIKARFMAQFPEFVAWPPEAGLDDPSRPFVMVVLGASPFDRFLDATVAPRRIKGHPVKVVYSQDPAALDACHMVFICDSEKAHLKEILARIGSRPILTVGDTEGFARKGVMINLTIEESLPRFEINLAAARGCGLGVNAQLLGLARKVW